MDQLVFFLCKEENVMQQEIMEEIMERIEWKRKRRKKLLYRKIVSFLCHANIFIGILLMFAAVLYKYSGGPEGEVTVYLVFGFLNALVGKGGIEYVELTLKRERLSLTRSI